MRHVEPGFRQLPIWFWPGFVLVIVLLPFNEYAAGLVGAFVGGFGFGRDYGWRRREREERAHEERMEAGPADTCDLCGGEPMYADQTEGGWDTRCAGCAPPEMVAAGEHGRIQVEERMRDAMRDALRPAIVLLGGDRSDTCHNGVPDCYYKVGWPIELQCEDCRGEEPRDSRCICGPVDRIFKEDTDA